MLSQEDHTTKESGFSAEVGCKPEQILQGAMQVFLRHGYAETSMDRVATEAGVSKHTIYNHFQGKEGLFVALIERLVIRHFKVEFGCELPLSEPPEQVLRRLGSILLARMDDSEYISFIRLVIAESGRFPELAQLYVREVVLLGDQALSHYFKSHPDLQMADPEMISRIFFGSLVSFVLSQAVLHGDQVMPIQKERLLDNLIGAVLNAP